MKASKINLYELIGLIIGDGSIMYGWKSKEGKKHYRLYINGDIKDDIEYFKEVSRLVFRICGKKPKIRASYKLNDTRLELYIYNKNFVEYLINKLKLDYGKKTFIVTIPRKFTKWRYSKHVLRGLFESDGSLYFSKSRITIKYPSYPRIEIRTVSKRLAHQIYTILKQRKFNVQFMITKYNDFKIYLSGKIMLQKWIEEIGFSNKNTISKYRLWKKFGYYIPNITSKQRKKLLKTHT